MRIAYVCSHKDCKPPRRKLYATPPPTVPKCEEHGRMEIQANKRYLGKGPR